jgi:TRAP-type C4-dicarboxylate transport system permease small subunit
VTGTGAARPKDERPYWALRIAESTLLVSALAGIGLFAWSLIDIIRIETAPGATAVTRELPAGAWPGIFVFFGSMVALQFVRMFLQRYRRDDGTPRGDERSAAAATAEALADTAPAEPAVVSTNDSPDA